MALTDAMVNDKEVDLLIHHHKTGIARWSEDEPDELRHHKFAVRYWETVKAGRVLAVGDKREDAGLPIGASLPPVWNTL